MRLSTAELSYLRDSLSSQPPIRPDARSASQFRPLEAITAFLDTANGSAKVRTADGAECIVGIKAKVTENLADDERVRVDVDIASLRDDHPLPNMLSQLFTSALSRSGQLQQSLCISTRYSYRLFIDCLVLSHSSHPLCILSFAIYLALMSTKLPLLLSSTDDKEAEEIPVFHDDWDRATYLCSSMDWRPPILFLGAVVENNVLVDPVFSEELVSETGIIMGWSKGQLATPVRSVTLTNSTSKNWSHGLNKDTIIAMTKLVNECGPDVTEALDKIARTTTTGMTEA